jgi:hypothetical protein
MKNLLISGETTETRTWDVNDILPSSVRTLKDDVDRIIDYNREYSQSRREMYENFYLNEELRKRI